MSAMTTNKFVYIVNTAKIDNDDDADDDDRSLQQSRDQFYYDDGAIYCTYQYNHVWSGQVIDHVWIDCFLAIITER